MPNPVRLSNLPLPVFSPAPSARFSPARWTTASTPRSDAGSSPPPVRSQRISPGHGGLRTRAVTRWPSASDFRSMVPIGQAPEIARCRVISEIYRPGVRVGPCDFCRSRRSPTQLWSIKDAGKLYNMRGWGLGYFRTNADGNVTVHPDQAGDRAIDLYRLALDLGARGSGSRC